MSTQRPQSQQRSTKTLKKAPEKTIKKLAATRTTPSSQKPATKKPLGKHATLKQAVTTMSSQKKSVGKLSTIRETHVHKSPKIVASKIEAVKKTKSSSKLSHLSKKVEPKKVNSTPQHPWKTSVRVKKAVQAKPESNKPVLPAKKARVSKTPAVRTTSAPSKPQARLNKIMTPLKKVSDLNQQSSAEPIIKETNKPIINETLLQKNSPSDISQLVLPTGPYLGEAQQVYFRARLIEWKQTLVEESRRTQAQLRDEERLSGGNDDVDRASREEQIALALRTRHRELHLIHKIEDSLRRLDTHDYGYCDSCGNEIGLGRLEARLTANHCVDCKQVMELKEKHQAR